MSTKESFNRVDLELFYRELGKLLHKRMKPRKCVVELVVVGGASILMNYQFRETTEDVDCIDSYEILMNDLIDAVAIKFNLPKDWINTSFIFSESYSNKLIEFSDFYKSYGNGSLMIRSIKDEYLIAMKLVAGRVHKHDYSDVVGIINSMKEEGKEINEQIINQALINLYGTIEIAKKEIYKFTIDYLNRKTKLKYEDISKIEKVNKTKLKSCKSKEEFLSIKEALSIIK